MKIRVRELGDLSYDAKGAPNDSGWVVPPEFRHTFLLRGPAEYVREMGVVQHELGEERRLRVAVPDGYERSDRRYPTIYALDERWTFGSIVDTVTMLAMTRAVPKCIVVGLGYQDEALALVSERRGSDFTPTEWPFPEFTSVKGTHGSGNAAHLRDLLIDDVVPLIDAEYRTDTADRVLFGHSLSGLCGLFTFLTRPGTFHRYLLASPSIWWDDRWVTGLQIPTAPDDPTERPTLYLAAGALETTEPAVVAHNAKAFAERLVQAGYNATFVAHDGETHHSVVGPAITTGLRTLFNAPT